MKITIEEKTEQPVMHRTKILATVLFEGAVPSRRALQKALAKHTNTEESLVVVEKIRPLFGQQKAKLHVFLYDDQEAMKAVVFEHMKKRHEKGIQKEEELRKAEEEKKKQEEQAAEKQEAEASAEETKEGA